VSSADSGENCAGLGSCYYHSTADFLNTSVLAGVILC